MYYRPYVSLHHQARCLFVHFSAAAELSNATGWVLGKFPFISSNFSHKCTSEITWLNDVISVPASSTVITEGEKKIKEWIPWVLLLALHYFLFENYSSILHLELPFFKLKSPVASAEYMDMTTHTRKTLPLAELLWNGRQQGSCSNKTSWSQGKEIAQG